ncbi:uncharacterized protein LOC135941464 [Cloeon dipterum]|uniref:uncharacterized protein LOC135941464 n=1 Tax=Cloeon dipterum TaxID=197152 RepID=UPI00321F88C6
MPFLTKSGKGRPRKTGAKNAASKVKKPETSKAVEEEQEKEPRAGPSKATGDKKTRQTQRKRPEEELTGTSKKTAAGKARKVIAKRKDAVPDEEQKRKKEEEDKAWLTSQIKKERLLIEKLKDTIEIKKFELVQHGPKPELYTIRDVMDNLLPDYSHINGFKSHEDSMALLTEEMNLASQVAGVELVELENESNTETGKQSYVAKFRLLAEEDVESLEFAMTFTSALNTQSFDDFEVVKLELLNGDVSEAVQDCFEFCLKNKDLALAVGFLKQYQKAEDERLNASLDIKNRFQDFVQVKIRKNVNIITLIVGGDGKDFLVKVLWGFQFVRKEFRFNIEVVYGDKRTEILVQKECGDLVDQLETARKYSEPFENTLVQFIKQLKNLKRRNSAVV